jgi:uncharacterized protein (DUF1800 family)
MDRRSFLTAKKRTHKKEMPVVAGATRHITSGLAPYTGVWGTNEVVHLLKRTMFGSKKADIDYFRTLTMTQAVDELLTVPATAPTPPLKQYLNSIVPAGDPDLAVPEGQPWVNVNTNDGSVNFYRVISLKAWWTGLMINQDRNILEKMVLFWHNHFATETNDISRAIWAYQNNAVLRQYALGNFKQFVKAVTLDTGMLRYLNGYLNTKTAPDENYARELQELFTVGKGPGSQYTENDVKAAAQVLTGWQVNGTTNTSVFTLSRHDTTNKQFSSFYGNTVITGRNNATAGDTELNDLLNMIFNVNEVALHICRKLYQWFVYYEIDAATEANVIVPLAQVFRTNNYDIKPVLNALFKSEHFFDVLNQGCVIKSPIDQLVSLCREFNVTFPATTDVVNSYNMWDFVRSSAAALQQDLGDPPSVSGWPAYYQAPQYYEIWINSDTLPKRNRLSDILVTTGYSRNGKKILIDPIAFTQQLSNPGDPNVVINESVGILFRSDLSAASKATIKKQILLSNQDQDFYWTNAWTAYTANPGNQANMLIVYNRLRDLYKYLMNLAEYQLA